MMLHSLRFSGSMTIRDAGAPASGAVMLEEIEDLLTRAGRGRSHRERFAPAAAEDQNLHPDLAARK